jgi:hypothetical protein
LWPCGPALASFFLLFIYLFFVSCVSGLREKKNICGPHGDLHKTIMSKKIKKNKKTEREIRSLIGKNKFAN